ncbi:MAG: hypothetical protein ACI9BD_001101 [Candidatus Marinamargulisbacteria bacterium]
MIKPEMTDASKLPDLADNPYYKKLRSDLKKKRFFQQIKQKGILQRTSKEKPEHSRQTRQAARKLPNIEDKSDLNSLRWDSAGVEGPRRPESVESVQKKEETDEKKESDPKSWKNLVHKINFAERVPELKQAYAEIMIQSKSHNFFVSKFAQFKVGVIGEILSWVGVPADELKKLKNKALDDAAKENIDLMGENLYNMELAEMTHGRTRRTKKVLSMFREIEAQLMQQMALFGKAGYWSKIRLMEERIKQLKRIKDEFIKEKDQLNYQFDFLVQSKRRL